MRLYSNLELPQFLGMTSALRMLLTSDKGNADLFLIFLNRVGMTCLYISKFPDSLDIRIFR